jgi:hypothetical protein
VDAPEDRDRVERARAGLAAELLARTPGIDARIRAEIEAEAGPVVSATIGAATGNIADGHEAVALAALFGRRIAALGQSPTTALAAVDAIDRAIAASGPRPQTPDVTRLRAAAMEGFASAVDERARTEMIERAGQSLTPMIVSPRVVLLVIAGCEDADAIAQALARLGRTALDSDAKACIVHASFAREPERDVAAEIAAFDGSAQMIGARAIFSGTPVALHAISAQAPALTFASTFEDALRRALDAAEQEVRPASLLSRGLKRLRG